ncbi:PHP domain-containing protein [Herpetosiphon giganteus]|uniref:PHP domain-containing protein n=1 Tax=Herpetosiphon giganteus TaxID=2029754 RepID=UPI00195AADAB|nr:hypothetical protein [Herpetosiphon giganteus]MBM7843545.1 putative metal-dependent phosphoesterase TrpH [Herpetosiphon giganteus]
MPILSTINLVLAADAAIDLQLHTTASDGQWEAAELIGYLKREGFGLAAITDHDRPELAQSLQALALAEAMPLLVAAEMSCVWREQMVDVLCFGFTLEPNPLTALAAELHQRQQTIITKAYAYCCDAGFLAAAVQPHIDAILRQPSASQPHAFAALVKQQNPDLAPAQFSQLMQAAGCDFATTPIATVVVAAQQSGALCILAHPGRDDGFVCFDQPLLEQLWAEVPLDGLEVDYPLHTPDQIAMYRAFAAQRSLLTSAGSDSHRPSKPPIRYRAGDYRALLGRLGIVVAEEHHA